MATAVLAAGAVASRGFRKLPLGPPREGKLMGLLSFSTAVPQNWAKRHWYSEPQLIQHI